MTLNFHVSTTVDSASGAILAVYFRIRTGKVAKSKVSNGGLIVADYNRSGALLGIEMLGPCTGKVLDTIEIDQPAKALTKAFVRRAAPRELMMV